MAHPLHIDIIHPPAFDGETIRRLAELSKFADQIHGIPGIPSSMLEPWKEPRAKAAAEWLLGAIDEHPWPGEPRRRISFLLFGGPLDGYFMAAEPGRPVDWFNVKVERVEHDRATGRDSSFSEYRYVIREVMTSWFTWDDRPVVIEVMLWDQLDKDPNYGLQRILKYLADLARVVGRSSWHVPKQVHIRRKNWACGLLDADILPELGMQVDQMEGWYR